MAEKFKVRMRELDPSERVNSFEEVALGYTKEEAIAEAKRCLQCKHKPCVSGCPVGIDIPGFIKALREDDIEKSTRILKDANNLPAICGRVCPQEKQCELACVVGKIPGSEPVAIGRLERFVADQNISLETAVKPSVNKRVAVIGAGPAGLTAAADLAKEGFSVTVFEAFHTAGACLFMASPNSGFPKRLLQRKSNL